MDGMKVLRSDWMDGMDGSVDEALCEMLGLPSLELSTGAEHVSDEVNRTQSLNDLLQRSDGHLWHEMDKYKLMEHYASQSYCIFPESLNVPAHVMRRLADEVIWGGETVRVHKSFEWVQVQLVKDVKDGHVMEKRTLTRLEDFVHHHKEWSTLCCNYLQRCISVLLGQPMLLYKEKLNIKPPGGSGFAPHLDTPSLRIALGHYGPQNFVTVMVAIDNMTLENGCLRISPGPWTEHNACCVIAPTVGGNPDAGGRAGAIPTDIADTLNYEDICVKAGTIVAFNGWTPHRSTGNKSSFPRRAVFLTYNPETEGDFHELYYMKMGQLRKEWKFKIALERQLSPDEQNELDALATIPRI